MRYRLVPIRDQHVFAATHLRDNIGEMMLHMPN